VSDGEALLWPRKKDFRLGEPVISDLLDPLPGDPTFLAASRQRAAPEVNHVMAECSDRCRIGRHGVIREIASELQDLTPVTVIVLVLHIGVQVCRILYEEDLLRRNCPEYSSYEASRWRLIPCIW
jgi:hypothetical protein